MQAFWQREWRPKRLPRKQISRASSPTASVLPRRASVLPDELAETPSRRTETASLQGARRQRLDFGTVPVCTFKTIAQ